MAGQYNQKDRLIKIDTPLGNDVLLLHGLSGVEGISRLFGFDLRLASEESAISFKEIVGQRVTISVEKAGNAAPRYINGYVSRFGPLDSDVHFTYYQAQVVPWLWFLTRVADCRIFQNMKAPDIIQKVFTDRGFNDFSSRLQGDYPVLEYCVQYRETDLNFVSRLMERYGIFYFFEHENHKHTLVLADSPSVHQPCPDQSEAKVQPRVGQGGLPTYEDVVSSWSIDHELHPGKYSLNDYNFKTPSTSLLASVPTKAPVGGNSEYEIYDYPGEYLDQSQGHSIVGLRMEEEEAQSAVSLGAGTCRFFVPGYRFDLVDHYHSEMNGSYTLTEIRHSASVGDTYTSGDESETSYSNHFTCIRADTKFRPARVTPKPVVQGPQTAVVVGPSGEEIYVDKYGRVKVQFFWDREGKRDEKSSCWIRVAQPWAGKNWGGMWIPRIGQEVVVQFLEGDPDQPIITGGVYNAEQVVPYTLPDYKTRSTMKSRSSKEGSNSNFNEIRFEDKKGSEQLFLHGERDMDLRVKNDSREWVGASRSLIVKTDQKETVEGNKNVLVKQNHVEKIQGGQDFQIQGDQKGKIGGGHYFQVGGDRQEETGSDWAHAAGNTIYLKAGMTVVIEAGMQLSLKAAGGFVDIGPEGVTIQGNIVNINSGGAAASGSGPNLQSPQDPAEPDVADDGAKGGKLS